MKVKQLIERLQKFDPEAGVGVIYDGRYPDEIVDVIEDASADAGEWSVALTNVPLFTVGL